MSQFFTMFLVKMFTEIFNSVVQPLLLWLYAMEQNAAGISKETASMLQICKKYFNIYDLTVSFPPL